MSVTNSKIIDLLKTAYRMELETVLNYVANSINLDGVRAEEIKKALKADIADEMNHAQMFGDRIKTLGGRCPGSLALEFDQKFMQPPEKTTDLVSVIRGVIQAEDSACKHYEKLIRECEGTDYVTQDLCITILADEQKHRRNFEGYLTEYAK